MAAVQVGTSNDQSRVVDSMVKQLQNSVFTAIALVMLVSLAALGPRASLLVGFCNSNLFPPLFCTSGNHGDFNFEHCNVWLDTVRWDAG